jgi:hypothetical protein
MGRIVLGVMLVFFLWCGTGDAQDGDEYDDKPLLDAAREGNEELFRLLLQKGAIPQSSVFEVACVSGNVGIARILVEKNVEPTTEAIDRCLFYGHKEMAVYLNGVLKKEKKREVDLRERCRMEPDGGVCLAAFDRAYFSPLARTCFKFIYGGCGGAAPFSSLEACKRVCEE